MLVISRRKDEKVRIGKDIYVTVVEIRSGQVRLGIEAPDDCRIVRDGRDNEEDFLVDYDQDYNS
ncbi:MAG: carbon storage regulator [Anaerobiospirillum succiniciproducens]|mgnify:FL=1|uniref:carbon storage regulator n=1 Tax=Anaerobiospirillum succiniciproducens TaxID=13335 RepID=UPI000421DD43|nr:carbon storage regulator [Anaerobiospirillum succiniciproducens]MCI6863572.1 carbon storage regulator [Anaerobiospirillum succiniciproducens]MDO4675385.1 carbon storage regulator [Anaerobiospirillum succiniciproducens]MDY2799415.1 carbon storage regulator [Anaerobiospirillum succiniciproducens]